MNIERIIERIKDEEGFRPKAYWDRKQWTYGYGCKAPCEGAVITQPEAEKLLWRHILVAVGGFVDLFLGVPTPINEVRQECLVDMIFNLGEDGVRKFRNMIDWLNGHLRRPLPRALMTSPVKSTSGTFRAVSSLTRRPVE